MAREILSSCATCKTSILWLEHQITGTLAPVEARPVKGGDVILLPNGKWRPRTKSEDVAGIPLYRHHVGCPTVGRPAAGDDAHPLEDDCKWCGAPIYWARYPKTGKWAPIDRAVNERGNLVVDLAGQTYRIAAKDEAGIERRLNHWATCPKADEHKREKKAEKRAGMAP